MSNTIKDLDDVDDDLFISKQPKNYIFAEKKAQDITERTNKMLFNTRSLVQESEMIGQSTLENLSTQRETLERVEDDLDNINSMTRATQKNLNNMRSFFGGFKSIFFGSKQNPTNPIVPSTQNKSGVPRSATLANIPSSSDASSSSTSKANGGSSNQGSTTFPDMSNFRPTVVADKRNSEPEDEFEANLSEIGFGLGRLKEMAAKLGDEIGDQNQILDRITDKSERAGDSIKHQNRQMQQLLKK